MKGTISSMPLIFVKAVPNSIDFRVDFNVELDIDYPFSLEKRKQISIQEILLYK